MAATATVEETARASWRGAYGSPRSRLWLLVVPMTLFFIVFFVFPVLSLFAVSLDKPVAGVVAARGDFVLNNFVRFFNQPLYYNSIFRTVWISIACSAIAALLGYPLAYLIAKTEHPGRNTFLMILVLASMQLDGVIRLYGMMVLLGDNGLINGTLLRWHAIDKPLPLMYNIFGVIAGDVQITLPFMVLSLIGVIQRINPSLEEAARSLGASRWATFRYRDPAAEHARHSRGHAARVRVGEQLLFRRRADGRLESVGAAYPYLPAGQQRRPLAIRRGDRGDPVCGQYHRDLRVPSRGRAHRRGSGMSDSARLPWPIKLGSALALIVLLLPVVIVVLAGLNAGDYLTFPPQGLSLRWVIAFLQSETFFGAYLFSLGLAAITMAISTVIGTMASIYLTRSPSAGAKVMRGLFLSPIVLPGIVLGLALYVFYVSTDIGLARTFGGLLIGHVLVTCPFVIATVSASLVGFDLSLEEAARSLGAGPLQAFRLVTLKIISPAVGAGSIFAFIISFGQFDLSLYLGTTNLTGLPYAMYISLRYKFEPTAAAAGIFAIALVIVSMVLSSRLINLRKLVARA